MTVDSEPGNVKSRAGRFDRVILTGFRATGKTAVCAKLADIIGFDCLDMDALLCAEMQCTITEYVGRNGWPAFRERERKLLARLNGEKGVVIATGGGAVMHRKEWEGLRRNSMVVWLKADAETIRQRLRKDVATEGQRPSLTGVQSGDEVGDLLRTRDPLYREGSDVSIDTAVLQPDEVVAAIVAKIISGKPNK